MLKFKRITMKNLEELRFFVLRSEDAREIMTVTGFNRTWPALKSCLAHSTEWTEMTTYGSEVIMLHGLSSYSKIGIPWMIASDGLYQHKQVLQRYSYKVIADMQKSFPVLMNMVDCRNAVHIRWIKHMGFTFDPTGNQKIGGVDFLSFFKRR